MIIDFNEGKSVQVTVLTDHNNPVKVQASAQTMQHQN